jgi:hypothetical protein
MKLFLGSLAALGAGIYDNVHFKPLSAACHTVTGVLARVFDSDANSGCALANAVAPWGTALIVAGSIGLAVAIGLFVVALVADGKSSNTAG